MIRQSFYNAKYMPYYEIGIILYEISRMSCKLGWN